MKKLGLGLLFVLLLTVSVSYVFAATYSYNVTVPRLGGTAYTENKLKLAVGNHGATGTHGGGYALKVRLENHNFGGLSSWYNFPSGSSFSLPNSGSANQSVRLALKTGSLTRVNVQSQGSWSPEP